MRTALCAVAAIGSASIVGYSLSEWTIAAFGSTGWAVGILPAMLLGGAIGKAFGRLARTPHLD